MTLVTWLGVWFVLQVIAILWLVSTARALNSKRSSEAKTTHQHNFAS
jgi:hypothetical protein